MKKETYETVSQKLLSGINNVNIDIPEEIIVFTKYLVNIIKFKYLEEENFNPAKLTIAIDFCLYDIKQGVSHISGNTDLPVKLRPKYNQIYKNLKYLVIIVENEFDQQFADAFKDYCIAAFGEKYFM